MTNIELISKLSELPHNWEVTLRVDGVVTDCDVVKLGRTSPSGIDPEIILQSEAE